MNQMASANLIEQSIIVKRIQKEIKKLDTLVKSYEQEYYKDLKNKNN